MPDAQKELLFKLTTAAELEGATDLAASLERQIGQAKALKQDYSELQAKLDLVTASIKESTPAILQQAEAFDKAAYESQNAQDELDKLTGSSQRAGEAAEGSEKAHRALRETMDRMNMIIPGLGDAMRMLAEGYMESSDAAGEATAANDSMATSMGAFAVVMLTIQAATEYYHMFGDAAKEAAEIQGRQMEKMVEASQRALDAWNKLNDAIHGNDKSPTDKYEKELEARNKIIEAEHRQAAAARENAEQEALANASTPEDQAIIKRNFAQQKAAAVVQDQSDTAEQQAEVAQQAQADLDARLRKIEEEKKRLGAMPASDLTGRTSAMNTIAKDTDDAAKLQDYINGLRSQVSTESHVNAIDQETYNQHNASNDRTTFEQAVQAGLGNQGQKIATDQQAALEIMNQIFKSAGGSFEPVLEYLKRAHLNQQQFQAYITAELNTLKQAQDRLHANMNNQF